MYVILFLLGSVTGLIALELHERRARRAKQAAHDATLQEQHAEHVHAAAYVEGVHRQTVTDHAAKLARLEREHEAALDAQRAEHQRYVAAVKGGAEENERARAKQLVEMQAEVQALRPYRDQKAKVMAAEQELAAIKREMASMADRHAQQCAAIHSEKDMHKREAERRREAHEQLAEKHKRHRAESWDQSQAQLEADRRQQVRNTRRALLALELPDESKAVIEGYFARITKGWIDAMRARQIAEQDARYAEQNANQSQDTGAPDGT